MFTSYDTPKRVKQLQFAASGAVLPDYTGLTLEEGLLKQAKEMFHSGFIPGKTGVLNVTLVVEERGTESPAIKAVNLEYVGDEEEVPVLVNDPTS